MKEVVSQTVLMLTTLCLITCASNGRKPNSLSDSTAQAGFSHIAANFVALDSQPELSVASKAGLALYFTQSATSYSADSITFMLGSITSAASSRLAKLVTEEFQLYPIDCLRKVQLDQLIFTKNIGISFPDGSLDSRSATLDPQNNSMIYSEAILSEDHLIQNLYRMYKADLDSYTKTATALNGKALYQDFLAKQKAQLEEEKVNTDAASRRTAAFMINVIHHEFYHFWDTKVNGSPTPDPQWATLNNPSFQYGSGGRFNRKSTDAVWNTNVAGFLDDYARSAVEEDKAEIFGALMAHPAELADRASNDPILAQKIALLKNRAQKFCPSMNSAFWALAEQSVVGRIQFGGSILMTDDLSSANLTIPSPVSLRNFRY